MKTKRPIAIIAVCTLLALAGGADVIGLVGIVREIARGHVTMWPSVFYAVVAPIFTLGCAAGMWRMRSWSVYLFAFWVTLQTILLSAWLGVFSFPALTLEILVIVVSFYYICGRRNTIAEPGASPNGGPARSLGISGVTERPPSVS